MLDEELDTILSKLNDSEVNINKKNRLALLASETGDKKVLNILHKLITNEDNLNCRGTFVYCLLDFPPALSFDLAVDLLIHSNFEVAHHAFEIINSVKCLNGGKALKAFNKLVRYKESNCDIVDWRKTLIDDAIDMFI